MTIARLAAALVLTASLTGGCGDDSEPLDAQATAAPSTSDEPPQEPGEAPSEVLVSEPAGAVPSLDVITINSLCDALTSVASELRGEPPTGVVEKKPIPTEVNDVAYFGAGCDFTYPGHETGSDPNAVTVYVKQVDRSLTAEDMAILYDEEGSVPIKGIGERADYTRTVDGQYVDAEISTLLGDDRVLTVYVTVPDALTDAPYLEQEPMVTALKSVLAMAG